MLVSIQFGARIQQAGGGGGGGGFGERIGRFVSGRERIFEVGREGNRDVGSVEKSLDCRDEYARKRALDKGILDDDDDDGLFCGNFFARELNSYVSCF